MIRYLPVIILMWFLNCGSASAFTLFGFYWPHSPVHYEITSSGSADVSDGTDIFTVRTAFATWQKILFNRLSFYEAGLMPWLPYFGDGHNTVGWIETVHEDWRTNGSFIADPTAGGLTLCLYNTVTMAAAECDIFLNGIHFVWSTTGAPNTVDIQTVLAHEVGHLIGLNHSQDPGALMHIPILVCTPQADDIIGARYLYFGGEVFDFVERLYHVVLSRQPDDNGLRHNVSLTLLYGEVETITSAFFLSPEFLGGVGADPTTFVTALYRTALNREPDPAGLMHNVNLITSEEWDLQWLVDGFLASPEFQDKDPFRSW